MIELLIKNDENKYFSSVYEKAKYAVNGAALLQMNSDIIGSRALGYAIYDAGAVQIGVDINRDYFANNYVNIFNAMQKAGTFESYITLIRSILGVDTGVNFYVPKKGHLIIEIAVPTGLFTFSGVKGGEYTDISAGENYGDAVLAFSNAITGLTFDETIRVIKSLNVAGIYLEVVILTNVPGEFYFSGFKGEEYTKNITPKEEGEYIMLQSTELKRKK
jgi:hypothetical protein